MKTIVKMQFGSHLYGTDTPASDMDFKGVFQAPYEDIILGKAKETVLSCTKADKGHGVRNTAEDTDLEMKELRRFLYDCRKGQTYALDMLFAPRAMILENSPEWSFINRHRERLLSKNIEPYIGYCRQQAGKYGLKGSRLGELKNVISFLEKNSEKTIIAEAVLNYPWSEFVYVEMLSDRKGGEATAPFLNVLGKKFQFSVHTHHALSSLKKMENEYGKRAEMAMNNEGVDWKAISHAYRCCYQLIELAKTGQIIFPLQKADYLVQIKTGQFNYVDLQDELYALMEEAIEAVSGSSLPEKPDEKFWEEFILQTYK